MPKIPTTTSILKDETAQKILKEFGLAGSAPEVQAQFLDETGELMMKRIVLELLKALAKTAHPRFDELLIEGDEAEWKKFLEPHLGDVDAFIEDVVKKEVAALRAEMGM